VSVSRFSIFGIYWLPVILWMSLIFAGSTGALSGNQTSRFLGPFLRWIYPAATDETVRALQFGIRKCGHLTEYAILAALLWRARRKPKLDPGRPWLRSDALFAIGIAALYAVSDEWHQSFEPTRYGSPLDVLIDTIGAALGIAVIWMIGRMRRRW